MELFIGTLAHGLTLGAIYSLAAVAFSLYGSNNGAFSFAPGGVWLIAALVSAAAGSAFSSLGPAFSPLALCSALFVAVAFGGAAGWVLPRASRLDGTRAGIWPLVTSAGVLMTALGLLQLVRQLHIAWRMPAPPPLFLFVANVFSVQIAAGQPVIIAFAAALIGALAYISRHSNFGRLQYAVSQDPQMAELLGVNGRRVRSICTLTACVLAATAGWMLAADQGMVAPENGLLSVVYVLLAVLLAGVSSLKGSAAAGFVVGIGQTFWSAYLGQPYVVLAVFAAVTFVLRFLPQRAPVRGAVEDI
jgi:branched-chain amino acid transport system permease protein